GHALLRRVGTAYGQAVVGPRGEASVAKTPVYPVDTAPQVSTLYATGEQIVVPTEQLWRYVCGSDTTGKTAEDLRAGAEAHAAMFADPANVIVVDTSGGARGGVNLVLKLPNPPAGAPGAFAIAESL